MTVAEFLQDRTEAEDGSRVVFRDLYAAYTEWAAGVGTIPFTNKKLGRELNELGFYSKKAGGWTYKTNLRLKTTGEMA